jgi:hypothetical protein
MFYVCVCVLITLSHSGCMCTGMFVYSIIHTLCMHKQESRKAEIRGSGEILETLKNKLMSSHKGEHKVYLRAFITQTSTQQFSNSNIML